MSTASDSRPDWLVRREKELAARCTANQAYRKPAKTCSRCGSTKDPQPFEVVDSQRQSVFVCTACYESANPWQSPPPKL